MTSIGPGFDPGASGRHPLRRWLALAVVLTVILGGTWWHLKGGGTSLQPRSGFDELATAAPQETQVLLAFDGRGQVDVAALVSSLETLKKQTGEVGKQIGDFEVELGVKVADLPKWLAPAGVVAIMPLEGQKTMSLREGRAADVVVCLSVTDEEAARQAVEAMVRANKLTATETDQEGVKLRVTGSGDRQVAFGVAHKRLWVGSGPLAVARGLKAVTGRAPSLADAPRFVDARKRCASSHGLLAWADVQGGAAALTTIPGIGPYADEQTVQALSAIEWVAVAADPLSKGQDTQVYVKVDPQSQNAFARALLDAQPVTPATARYVPAKWGSCVSVNTSWLGAVAYQGALLLPLARTRLGNVPALAGLFLGFDPVAAFRAATTGDLVLTCDAVQTLAEAKPPSVVGVLPLKDEKAARELIARLEKRLKMPSRVVKTSGDLEIRSFDGLGLHWAITGKPQPVLLLARGPQADAHIEEALRSASQPGDSMEAVPEVKSLSQQARGKIVETDFNDFSPLLAWATKRLTETATSSPQQAMVKTWLLAHLQGGGPYTTCTVISVEADGLRLQARGLTASMLSGGLGVLAASALPHVGTVPR